MFDIFDENGYTGEGTEETGNVDELEPGTGSSPETNNDYSYYDSTPSGGSSSYSYSSSSADGYKEPDHQRKSKGGSRSGSTFGQWIAKAACLGLVFGLVASGVMFFFNTAACLFTGAFKSKAEKPEKKEIMAFVIPALVSGLFSCVYNRLNIFLSGALIGMIFYPGFNGGVVILSTILSVVFLREKLSAKQIIGILIGVAGICIIGIF